MSRRFRPSSFIATALIASLIFTQFASAATQLADSNDFFDVYTPGPNAIVRGTVTTTWRVFDNNQATIPYELNLLDSARCDVKVATLAAGNATGSTTTNINTPWNSAGSFPETAQLADGNYCMELCVSLRKGTTSYSACNARIVTVRNTNANPVITTVPPADRTIDLTEAWSYDVNATDANGDGLSFAFITNPAFLSINQNTGLIFTNATLRTAGTYDVLVQVRDPFGGIAQQSFSITVVSGAASSTSSSVSSTTSATSTTSSTTSAGQTNALGLKFISPTKDAVFSGVSNSVAWEVSSPDKVNIYTLSYSLDGQNWTKITDLPSTSISYTWDVSQLKAGSYTLQLLAKTTDNTEVRVTSPSFVVKTETSDIISKPLIVDVTPSDSAELRERRPLISGKFTPPIEGTIDADSFKFWLDDVDKIDLCEVTSAEFKCTPVQDLDLGLHKVKVEIKDFSGQTATKEWVFTIIETGDAIPEVPSEGVVFILGRAIPTNSLIWAGIICLAALLLLLIPWVLYSIWRRRQADHEDSGETSPLVNVETFPQYTPPPAPATPEVTVNYYPETATTEPIPAQQETDWSETITVAPPENTPVLTEPTEPTLPASEIFTPTEIVDAEPLAPATEEPTTSTTDASAPPDSSEPLPAAQPSADADNSAAQLASYGYGKKVE